MFGTTDVVEELGKIGQFSAVRDVVEAFEVLSVDEKIELTFPNGELRNLLANSENIRAAADKSSAIFFT